MWKTAFCAVVLCGLFSHYYADEVVWSGEVNSDGTPTNAITLEFDKTYQIKASGYIKLGKWIQAQNKLANDACFEFNKEKSTVKLESLKNSLSISICDGTYHPDHMYQSEPFVAKNNRIHFWIDDTDYDDNTGAFHVEIVRKGN